MANSDKNIVITPNIGSASDPVISFSGANTSIGPQTIDMNVYPTNGGTLSLEGSSGQLLTINNSMTGTIYSVNDLSGVPAITVSSLGDVALAPYGGTVKVGGSLVLDGGTAATSALKLTAGSLLTTPVAGAFEYDTTNTVLHFTGATAQGRALIPAVQLRRLITDSAATATTISPFFGATSSIPLVANGVYEIEMEVFFLKNTTGTLVWTLTNSTTVTNMQATVWHTPTAGYTTVPTATTLAMGGLINQTAAAAAFTATASLNTGTSHWARFKIILENGASTSLRLNVTNSAGTITPRRGSYWKATRIASTNVGTYVA